MSFAIVAAKSTDGAFRARLTVAITEQCRYMLEQPQGSRSSARFAWDIALAREVVQMASNESTLSRYARLCLLPAVWGAFNPDDDTVLLTRVAERMPMFASTSPPA